MDFRLASNAVLPLLCGLMIEKFQAGWLPAIQIVFIIFLPGFALAEAPDRGALILLLRRFSVFRLHPLIL
jgi:hypothetical protein